jgi:LmbE family N-acetylglucosaminyl deacetylase
MKVVSIGAHPDDIEIGSGGTLAMHKRERRDNIFGILCTLGGVRGARSEREIEARDAARLIGIDRLHILDFPVSKLNNPKSNHEFTKVIEKVIDEIGPDRVYTHSELDYHQVHVTVSKSVVEAARSVGQILLYETISSTSFDFKPNAFVEITNYIDDKIKSIQAHKSQYKDRFYLQANVLRSLANVRYVWGKVGPNPNGMAEGFVIQKFSLGRIETG